MHPVINSAVVINSGPTTAEFIVSLVIVGILGPALGVLAAWSADRRRFAHERKLKASDDLIARIDAVAESLDRLCEVCSIMRITAALLGPENVETLKAISEAEHVHIRTRALNSRLAMRPHAAFAVVPLASISESRRLTRSLGGGPFDRLVVAVEHIGVKVKAVGPDNGTQLGIDADLTEVGGVLQRLGHRPPQFAR